jgi:transcription antitermination factor NusA-like protein
MDAQSLEKLKSMLAVPIEKVEEQEDGVVVYVPNDKIARAIGSNGSVVRAAELVLNKKLTIKGTSG